MKRSLHIGINDYPGTKMDLKGCINDANDWEKELRQRGFSTNMLVNQQATKQNIINAFKNIIDVTGHDDIAVITYSGHGTWVPDLNNDEDDSRDEALCPYDIQQNGPLIDDTLQEMFNSRGWSSRIIFISDSCHSGTVARSFSLLDQEHDPVARFMPPETFMEEKLLSKAFKVENVEHECTPESATVLFSGCKDTEFSYDASFGGRANGAFTHVALGELKKMKKDSTYGMWYKAIREYLPHQRYPQTPQLQCSKQQKRWKIFEA